jgi:(2R)-sulfolactate sulfo-lyase subunit alpha
MDATTTAADQDQRLLMLAEGDNVLIVTGLIPAGETFRVAGVPVVAASDLPTGFKVAARDLAEGEIAIRLRTPIGRTTAPVGAGELVHTHNLASQYLRTHERGEV